MRAARFVPLRIFVYNASILLNFKMKMGNASVKKIILDLLKTKMGIIFANIIAPINAIFV
jgi:hypothetical protein